MIVTRVLTQDPLQGLRSVFHYDTDTDETVIETVQDVEPYLERNKNLRNNPELRAEDPEMWHVASIPAGVQLLWRKEGVDIFNREHWPEVRRRLNSPEWAYLRTRGGRI